MRPELTRRKHFSAALLLLLAITAPAHAQRPAQFARQSVRISVLSLFKPTELILCPAQGSSLTVTVGSRTLPPQARSVVLRAANGQIQAKFAEESLPASGLSVLADAPSGFWLEVPGKLRRRYTGSLDIRLRGEILEAVVTMPLETAVASVVAAESPPGAGMEALKAQAVAARSFFAARQTAHTGFDFCDTTHCQFLRSPPPAASPAAQAARDTAGLVLTWSDPQTQSQTHILAALYARSCGGLTRTLRQAGIHSNGYPYYTVRCAYCSHHPELWRRDPAGQSQPAPATERDRLAYNRIHGWGAIPSLPSQSRPGTLRGRGIGHGIGLCQLGAADMARHGATFARILAHYYPNTQLAPLPRP